MSLVIHWLRFDGAGFTGCLQPVPRATIPSTNMTTDPAQVTCRDCQDEARLWHPQFYVIGGPSAV